MSERQRSERNLSAHAAADGGLGEPLAVPKDGKAQPGHHGVGSLGEAADQLSLKVLIGLTN